jgi:hypothetical protein
VKGRIVTLLSILAMLGGLAFLAIRTRSPLETMNIGTRG